MTNGFLFYTIAVAAFIVLPFEAASSDPAVELRSLLPAGGETHGWERSDTSKVYEPGNLWEYINGQSEHYLNYGFEQVVVGEYSSGDGTKSIVIEIYRMKNSLCGFGIYASERSPEDEFVDVGVEGYLGGNVLNYWKGPYYVKLTAFERSAEVRDTLLRLASSISVKISGEFRQPDLFEVFSEKNRVTKSERYIPINFMGHSFLGSGYRVDYQEGDDLYQVFLVDNPSKEDAVRAFDRFREFLVSGGKEVFEESEEGVRRMRVKAPGNEVYFQYESFFGGVMGMGEPSHADQVIGSLLTRIKAKDPA